MSGLLDSEAGDNHLHGPRGSYGQPLCAPGNLGNSARVVDVSSDGSASRSTSAARLSSLGGSVGGPVLEEDASACGSWNSASWSASSSKRRWIPSTVSLSRLCFDAHGNTTGWPDSNSSPRPAWTVTSDRPDRLLKHRSAKSSTKAHRYSPYYFPPSCTTYPKNTTGFKVGSKLRLCFLCNALGMACTSAPNGISGRRKRSPHVGG